MIYTDKFLELILGFFGVGTGMVLVALWIERI